MAPMRRLRARPGRELVAELRDLVPLRYADGGSDEDDRPPHVRGASALVREGDRLVIVQDDVHVLAVLDADGAASARLLPVEAPTGQAQSAAVRTFDDRRGNKHRKLDLEAAIRLADGRIVAFGSGSSPLRERLVVLDSRGEARIVEAASIYAGLRAEPEFAGSELNIEGAVVDGDAIRLFQRGNGAPRAGLEAVTATADLSLAGFLDWLDRRGPPPRPEAITQFELGEIEGVRLAFTDATRLDDGRIAFLACAEGSPDAVQDGPVLGCVFGVIDGGDVAVTPVVDPSGRRVALKLEGLAARPGTPGRFDVVVDMDRIDEPARLGRIVVSGWRDRSRSDGGE